MADSWKTLRSLTTQAAEGTSAPSDGTLVSPAPDGGASCVVDDGLFPYVEIAVDTASLAGSPSSVVLGVWRAYGGKILKIATITILSGDIAAPIPSVVDFNGQRIWVTVESFPDGSTPTFTGNICTRPVRL
jgi:hypothetical protein